MPDISVNDAIKGGKSLRDFLAYCLKESVQIIYNGSSRYHPVITVNALKNIIGDDLDHPSEVLLESAYSLIERFPKRKDDADLINRASSDGIEETAFISDIWERMESGDTGNIALDSAKIHLASDRGPAVLESVAEYALTNIPEFGSLTYHVLRAFAFQNDPKGSWPFVMCLLQELKKVSLFEMHSGTEVRPRECITSVLASYNQDHWLDFASISRIWSCEYVRTDNYHREISHWLSGSFEKKLLPSTDKKAPDLADFVDGGNAYFVSLAEDVVNQENGIKKIPLLEALRTLAKRIQKKELPFIQDKIHLLVNSKK